MSFKKEYCNWIEYRKLPNVREVDFHWSDEGPHDYWESMEKVATRALDEIKSAYESGKVEYVLFTHG